MNKTQVKLKNQQAVNLLLELINSKIDSYGTARYEEENYTKNKTFLYSDIYRKFIRLEEILFKRTEESSVDDLMDSLIDMAGYCIMGLVLIDLNSKKILNQPKKVTDELRIEQIAIATNDPDGIIANISSVFGKKNWITDVVYAEGIVGTNESSNTAELNFNYDMGNFEFEILNYIRGDNWHNLKGKEGNFLSHLGFHVDSIDEWKLRLSDLKIIQEVQTTDHTNQYLKETGRHYKYCIFDTEEIFGFDLKLIERI